MTTIAKSLTTPELTDLAKRIRRDVLVMVTHANSGHPGGPLSMADYLTALLFRYLHVDPIKPGWADRDRFILSNGHASALLYSLMAQRGFFDPSYLLTFRSTGSRLLGHPSSCVSSDSKARSIIAFVNCFRIPSEPVMSSGFL